jgi:hypothetical protein
MYVLSSSSKKTSFYFLNYHLPICNLISVAVEIRLFVSVNQLNIGIGNSNSSTKENKNSTNNKDVIFNNIFLDLNIYIKKR